MNGMQTLISFATQWGSKHGGINCFNTDFLIAFGVAYHHSVQVICIVGSASKEEIEEARNANVTLVSLPYEPQCRSFTKVQSEVSIDELAKRSITFEPAQTVWIGHDVFTGEAAIAAAKIAGGRSALIHHMSYDHYESYAEDSKTAYAKVQAQVALFTQADLVLAIGPLLRDALSDLLKLPKSVHMLIPGLAEIVPSPAPKSFTVFMSGRLCDDAARIKQGHLGIAGFAKAHREAREKGMPDGLRDKPKLVLRGVNFETPATPPRAAEADPETELKKFAERYGQGVLNLQALPYTHDRQELYGQLRSATVALMPSWHEGFGLVAWEAIAAGVPLIISKDSGVYRFLEEELHGAGTGCVYPIQVSGKNDFPFFQEEDLANVVKALNTIANDKEKARKQAGILRELVSTYSWSKCAEQMAEIFSWNLRKGSLHPALRAGTTKPLPVANAAAVATAVISGLPIHIPLARWRVGSAIADSQLLRAEEALVPFDTARHSELEALSVWLDSTEYPQALRLITGEGGLGKTRLALEICKLRKAAGWQTGFLNSELAAHDMATAWVVLRNLVQPLLIVIDYAETRQATLIALIKAILQSPGNLRVRVLLLARDAGEWWDNLPGKDQICEPFLSGYATSGPYELMALHTQIEDRRHAYQLALHAFSEALNARVPNVIPDLTAEHFSRPLYLQMAALLALHGERPTSAQGLTKALLNHERRYWHGLFTSAEFIEPARHAEQLLALTTLAGGFPTARAALPYWQRADTCALSQMSFNQLFSALVPLYPGEQGLQAIRPDLLGEGLVAQALLRTTASDLLGTVLSREATQEVRLHALTVLARLANRYHELHETITESLLRDFAACCRELIAVATATPSSLPILAEAAFVRLPIVTKDQIVGMLKFQMVEDSVQLARFNCAIFEHLAYKSRQKHLKRPTDIDSMNSFAIAEANYGIWLVRAGLNDQALDHAWQALEIHERLAQKNPDRFGPDLATSLSNYASRLRDEGSNGEAQEFARRALEIRKKLAQKNADRFEPDLAASLSNYASHLSEAGRNDEAQDLARQALEIRKRLAQKNPDRFEPDLATSLSNYANRLSDVGRYDEAQDLARQALEIRKRLAQRIPDRFEPDLATSLSNYASHLSEAGCDDEALELARQALEIHKRLAQKNPDRFEPNLATSLSNYASHLNGANRDDEAQLLARQALEIHTRLVQKNPDRFEPDLATSLSNYANRLSDAGRDAEALELARQALEIHKRLAQKNPDRFEPDLATSLSNYANRLSDVGRYDEAQDLARQALEIHTLLAEKYEFRFARNLAFATYDAMMFEWLAGGNGEPPKMDSIFEKIRMHHLQPLQSYALFVQSCVTSDRIAQAEGFERVVTMRSELSPTGKIYTRDHWLCAAAWCAKFSPTLVEAINWQTEWHHYVDKRQGRVPRRMDEFARRMGFKWPTSK
jgi:glycosyltransferase involved in cell wall biosynthesis